MIKNFATLLLAAILFAGCNSNNYQKTPSGVLYKITKGNNSEKLKQGQIVKFNIEYRIDSPDSVLSTSYGHMANYMMVDTTQTQKHSFLEVITQCGINDKLEFILNIDTLTKLNMIQPNPVFKKGGLIKGKAEFIQVFKSEAEAISDNAKESKLEKDRELKDLKDLIQKRGITTRTAAEGVLVEIQTPGDMTKKADSGTVAKVLYKGILADSKDGKPFDSNMDPKNPNSTPLMVTIAQRSVIPGLDYGLRLFGKGGKGKVYIPAMLAYGPGGSPPVIPPYANLIFEVEVLDVTPAPPAVSGK